MLFVGVGKYVNVIITEPYKHIYVYIMYARILTEFCKRVLKLVNDEFSQ